MSTPKMKGLLKGLRYISNMFENEKEPEMQIGLPTDVKHVAHIGWDGPSVNSPSWMDDFKQQPGFASAPLQSNGNREGNDSAVKWVSQDSNRKGNKTKSTHEKDLPGLPKSSKRHTSAGGYPPKDKSDKPRQSKRSSKHKDSSTDRNQPTSESMDTMQPQANDLPDIPKKARRKRSKECSKQRPKSVETDQSEYSDTETASLT